MIEALIVIGATLLNRVRGGGLGGDVLPGHPRFYVAAAMAGLALLVLPEWKAAAVGAAYLWWAILPWGHWYDLGRLPLNWQGREQSQFERAVSGLCGDDDHIAFFMRNIVGFLPMSMLVGSMAVFAAPLQVIAYEACWRVQPKNPIEPSEFLTGALWGALILSSI